MLVAGGYPEDYKKGDLIKVPEIQRKDTTIYHAGTTFKDGKLLTNGGRVLAVTSLGTDISDALKKSNEVAKKISFENKYFRSDIGLDLLKKK